MQRFVVGIDLGTTNTVVAYTEAGSDQIRLFPIEQLVAPGEIAERPLLPSARYHPAPGQLAEHDLRLPWPMTDPAGLPQVVFGSFARDLGAQVPGRLAASAKSWLSHPSVDRLAPILPWGAAEEVGKVSPVTASGSYLAYVRAAWNGRFPHHPLEQQDVVLTVPASFDEGARTLTLQAAHLASLANVRLLEEPQAAFYDWVYRHRESLGEDLEATRLVLVCDVGGGTTDLTLIRVEADNGPPRLTRIGVGDHLMLGGDNMDLALAHRVEPRLAGTGAGTGARLSATRLAQLVQQCRRVKERLLAAGAPANATLTLLGTGAQVIAGTVSVELAREEVEQTVVDGFFPRVAPQERPARLRGGIVELGLPYAADAAITRHVAAFLAQHAQASRDALGSTSPDPSELPVPDALLLNGGVFRASALATRIEGVLGEWRREPLRVLHNANPDVAVARGAVAHALAREGRAPKIGGGSARSFFLVLEDDERSRRGICVLPRGTEEAREIRLADRTFALRLGRPVSFHLVSSVADRAHRPGELADLGSGHFVRLPPIATVVDPGSATGATQIAVQLSAALTEVGTMQMQCVSTQDAARRWQLEFQLRGEGDPGTSGSNPTLHPRLPDALEKIERIFGSRSRDVGPREVKHLRVELERLLGGRDGWDMPLLRELFSTLWNGMGRRRRSADHERLWMNLTGYCLRPGFGYPLDEWRIEQLWSTFGQGIQYGKENQIWSEWWTLWRRVAGGLPDDAQRRLMDEVAPHLHPGQARSQRASGAARHGYEDMVRLVASLERVPAGRKVEVGDWLLERLRKPAETPQGWWAVGRIGAREPFYGSAHNVVPVEVATRWLTRILGLDWNRVEPARFAATQIARMTGDRTRDLPPEMRAEVVRRLESAGAPRSWIGMVGEVVRLEEADRRQVFGESLPPGLKLLH